ncbi:MAG: hypothetical protein RL403_1687, partial [Bacteroidota bacterium]
MKVIKFGGSSVENPNNIQLVFQIIQGQLQKSELVVVFSAFGGVTEQLFALANLAKSGDLGYKTALLALEQRHLDMANALLGNEKREKVDTFIRQRFHELEDLYHGIFLIKEQSPRTLDYVASFGERLSTFILAEALTAQGIPTCFVDAREIIRTDDRFGQARVD